MKKAVYLQVRSFAPATIANVVCGYDILGFAAAQPGDEVVITADDREGVRLQKIEGDDGLLPLDPQKNVASFAVQNYLQKIGSTQGVNMILYKKMPLNSGMGSSASSTVAALVGINELMGNLLTREELLPLAMEAERLACGSAHADNVAPALLGGLVLVRSYHPLDVIKLPYPNNLSVMLLHPHVDVPTRSARKIIKRQVALEDAVIQWGNIAGLVTGFCTHDIDLISRSMVDHIIEPVRAMLIPHFANMRATALQQGAIGFGISGSGPSVFALCKNDTTAQTIAKQLQSLLQQSNISSETYITQINQQGAMILESK